MSGDRKQYTIKLFRGVEDKGADIGKVVHEITVKDLGPIGGNAGSEQHNYQVIHCKLNQDTNLPSRIMEYFIEARQNQPILEVAAAALAKSAKYLVEG